MKPSISKLIEQLDRPALVKWANKIGLQGIHIDDYESKSRSDGSNKHFDIERYLKFKIESDDQEFNSKMVNFFKDKEIIGSEIVVENEYFVGRYDVKFKYKDFTFIGDFKSATKGRVYFETKLQLAAYAMIEKCHICVIHLPEFLFHPITINHGLYEEFIVTLSSLYELRSKIDQLK